MIYIFTGPTLAPRDGAAVLDARYLAPVAQGDLYRVAQRRPRAIGIIDGYFERIPAVWHKEILWAMSQGIHVYGSASMGALRAVELEAFGMVGVGHIFESFRSGELEDDDEVTVVHAPAEHEYRPLSEAMVNIRSTLARATAQGVIGGGTRRSLEQLAKELPYQERSWERLLGSEPELSRVELDALHRWLPQGRVDQKREDALAMLRRMAEEVGPHAPAKRVSFTFAHSNAWDRAIRRSHDSSARFAGDGEVLAADSLLEELRLRGEETYRRALADAFARLLSTAEARRQGGEPSKSELRSAGESFRRRHGLLLPQQVEEWLAANDLDPEGFLALVAGEALIERARTERWSEILLELADSLRSVGAFAELVSTARQKRRELAGAGLENPSFEDCGLTEESLYHWYFRERLGTAVSDDLAATAERLGFKSEEALRRAVLRERCFFDLRRRARVHPDATEAVAGEVSGDNI